MLTSTLHFGNNPEDTNQAVEDRHFATQAELRERMAQVSTFNRVFTAPPFTESIAYEPNSSGQYLEYLARLQDDESGENIAGGRRFACCRRRFCKQGAMRWFLLCMTGLCTAFVAVAVDLGMEHLSHFRMTVNDKVVDSGVGVMVQYLAFEGVCLGFVAVAAGLVCFVEDLAAGSGIPEIKCYLNGVALQRVVGLKTLLAKAVGIVFSVAAGLPCGKEGPMIHSGAIVGRFMSEARWGDTKPFALEAEQRDFVAAGAAAGVAAAFGAPFGSVLFAIEEGASYMNNLILLKLFVASAVATLVVKFFIAGFEGSMPWGRLGSRVPVSFGYFLGAQQGELDYEVVELPIFALIAAMGGLLGALFNAANKRLTQWRSRHIGKRGCWRFIEAMLVTLVITSISFFVPTLLHGWKPLKLEELSESEKLFWRMGSDGIRSLFHHALKDFNVSVVIGFALTNYATSCLTYGLGIPSGLFVPSLLTGAAFGRMTGDVVARLFPAETARPWASQSLYALVGATSMLAGTARITISLAMILLEVTGAVGFALPLFLAVMVAKWTGDHFTRGIYDMHIIELKHVPLLETLPEREMDFMQVRDVMATDVIMFEEVEVISNIVRKLNSCSHNGFPIVYNGTKEFCGVIRRSSLNAVLLYGEQHRAFMPIMPSEEDATDEPCTASSTDTMIRFDTVPWDKLKARKCKDIQGFKQEQQMDMRRVDLRPYINRNGYNIPQHAPLASAYVLARQVGIRHLPVVSRGGIVVGIVTRKDLILVEDDKIGRSDSEQDSDSDSESVGYVSTGLSEEEDEEEDSPAAPTRDPSRHTVKSLGIVSRDYGA